KSGAFTDPTIHFNLSSMLLNNSIGDGQPEAGPTPSDIARLGSEERVIYPLDVFLRYAGARVGNQHLYAIAIGGADSKRAALRHRVLRIQKQVQEDLLQLTCVAVDGRQTGAETLLHANMRGLHLVL